MLLGLYCLAHYIFGISELTPIFYYCITHMVLARYIVGNPMLFVVLASMAVFT